MVEGMLIKKVCVEYCRIGNTEYLPGTEYQVEFNPIDRLIRIYDVWGYRIVSCEFINRHFI